MIEIEAQKMTIATAAAETHVIAEISGHIPGILVGLGVPAPGAIETRLIQRGIAPTFGWNGGEWRIERGTRERGR